jgi:hypothetical protein
MKARKVTFVVAMLLAFAFVAVPGARAQMGLTYTSSIQVQNLSGSNAQISIQFFDEASQTATSTVISDTIAPGANKAYFPLPDTLGTFRGSAVVSADQPVAAITNLLGNGGAYAESATGLASGSGNVGLPLVMRNNSGFSTFFSVQNAGTADATITINYTPGTAGSAAAEGPITLKPGASRTFDQSTNNALGAKFIGSASITSNQPVVAMVSQVGTGSIRTLLLYDGFSGGSTNVRAPLVMSNNSGYFTSLNVQNVGSAPTTVTVSYSANQVGGFAPVNETLTLNPGQGGNLLQAAGQWANNRYIGSATLTASQPLVVVVNELKIDAPSQGSAYEGLNPAGLTTKASAPLLMSNNGGYITSVQCQNAGAAPATVTVTYSANTVGGGTPAPDTRTVAPGANVTIFQAPTVDPKWEARYIGSATITATQPVACLVNELGPSSGDTLLTYNAINY